ncbi:MAG: HAMP domain-containing histidine kinase [Arcobacteraceae bacterium]|nr:HAMP domain-containing histidine kinase [Arcobacteraceae bacterium]
MFKLGLNDDEFLKFKENERHLEKISEQTRLAAMGEMIGNIAHQWRQPLSVISTNATGMMMQKEYDILTDESFNKSCNDINNNAQYLSKTIDDFRDFIKGDSEEEKFDIKRLIDKSLTIVNSSLKDSYVELIINNNCDTELFGALNMLIQAIVNIVNNAKDILVEKNITDKFIFINTFKTNNEIVISILDNGGGVPSEIIPKIFDAYFTTKHQSQGTGLGLNMAHSIIHNSFNGILDVINETYEHKNITYTGAKFTITIPLI